MGQSDPPGTRPARTAAGITRRDVGPGESAAASRQWWDAAAEGYQDEHGAFLGDADFVWGPEGLRETDAGLLGDPAALAGRTVVELGCGAAQCARWLARQGARVVGVDLSAAQLAHAAELDRRTGTHVPVVQADAGRLPVRDESVDAVCSAYGALPFVADSAAVLREVARVLRPGGRFAMSVSHPLRWCLPDDPGPNGLVVRDSYFDRTPYVEIGDDGIATYVEHHRTFGDRVREIVAAGLRIVDVVEPEWPETTTTTWGGWSPLRGRLIPGTAIFVGDKPASRVVTP